MNVPKVCQVCGTSRGEGGGVTLPSVGAALDRNGDKAGQSAAGSA